MEPIFDVIINRDYDPWYLISDFPNAIDLEQYELKQK